MSGIDSRDYWNKRVRQRKDKLKDMLFIDGRRDEYWRRVREVLEQWKDLNVVDICCGYGQFSDIFSQYLGVDFSDEMIKLAKERSKKEFINADIKEYSPPKVDVIFEVNSLHSLGWSPQKFVEKFAPFARVAIACLEADYFFIYQKYE